MQATDTSMTTAAACEKCRYWEAKEADNGECRRHAPQAVVLNVDDDVKFESHFPTTAGSDWCGDFAVKA